MHNFSTACLFCGGGGGCAAISDGGDGGSYM